MAPAKNSVIIINNFEGKELSEIEINIQKRFAKVLIKPILVSLI
jgi:hypothetical protein